MATKSQISDQLDYLQSQGWMKYFQQAAAANRLPVSVLLAIASRETGMGTDSYYRKNNFTGRDGHGKGIMQIDDRYHDFALLVPPDNHQQMIYYGAQHLAELNESLGNIEHAISAYNAGESRVKKAVQDGIDPDLRTTGGDYAEDVLARADMIQELTGSGISTAKIAGWLPSFLILSAGAGFIYQQLKQQANG